MPAKNSSKIESSRHRALIDSYLDQKLSPAQIIAAVTQIDSSFSITEPTLYKYKKDREKQNTMQDVITCGGTINPVTAVKNDGIVLDLIINQGMESLKNGEATITIPMVLKAMDMKKDLLGVTYKGQTIWALFDYQKQFDDLIQVLGKRLPQTMLDLIIEDLRELGWTDTMSSDITTESLLGNYSED